VASNGQCSAKLIVFGLTVMAFSSVPLYKRVIKGEEKKKQIGELTPDGGLRMFDEKEIEKRERESYFTQVFGSDRK
jgi:hypothetical protein